MYKDLTLFLYTRDDLYYYTNAAGEKYDVLYEIIWLEYEIRVSNDKDFPFGGDIDHEYEYLIDRINMYIDVSSWAEKNIQGEIELETKFMNDYENETFDQAIVDTIIKDGEIFVSPEFVLWFIKHSERNDEKRFEL